MKTKLIDTLSYPLRWLAAYVMSFVCPDFLELVVDETPLIARRVVESTMDEVGLDATGIEFVAALQKRMDNFHSANPQEYRLLLVYALVNGFESREAMWQYEFDKALNRRNGDAV